MGGGGGQNRKIHWGIKKHVTPPPQEEERAHGLSQGALSAASIVGRHRRPRATGVPGGPAKVTANGQATDAARDAHGGGAGDNGPQGCGASLEP